MVILCGFWWFNVIKGAQGFYKNIDKIKMSVYYDFCYGSKM